MSSTWLIAACAMRGKPRLNARGTVTRAIARLWTSGSWEGWRDSVRAMCPISCAISPASKSLFAARRETCMRWSRASGDCVAPMISMSSTTALRGHFGARPSFAYAASTDSYARRTFSGSARPVLSTTSRSAVLPLRDSVGVEELGDLASLEVHLHDRGFEDLDVPLEQGELLLLERVRGHREDHDRLPLHHELVHVLDEHQGLQEAVVDRKVLDPVQEDDRHALALLDEPGDQLREGPDRGRVVVVLPGRVAEPDDPAVRDPPLPPDPLRVLAGDDDARGPIPREHREQPVAEVRLLLLDQVAQTRRKGDRVPTLTQMFSSGPHRTPRPCPSSHPGVLHRLSAF